MGVTPGIDVWFDAPVAGKVAGIALTACSAGRCASFSMRFEPSNRGVLGRCVSGCTYRMIGGTHHRAFPVKHQTGPHDLLFSLTLRPGHRAMIHLVVNGSAHHTLAGSTLTVPAASLPAGEAGGPCSSGPVRYLATIGVTRSGTAGSGSTRVAVESIM